MNFTFSKRAEAIEEGIFAALAHKKNELAEKGMEVYNFSIGTPDFQPPKHVMDAMVEACKDPEIINTPLRTGRSLSKPCRISISPGLACAWRQTKL